MLGARSRFLTLAVALTFVAQSALAMAHAFAAGELVGAGRARSSATAPILAAGPTSPAHAPGHTGHDRGTCPVAASAVGARLALAAPGAALLGACVAARGARAPTIATPPALRAQAPVAPRAPPDVF